MNKEKLSKTPCPVMREVGCMGADCGHWSKPFSKCGLSAIGSGLHMISNAIVPEWAMDTDGGSLTAQVGLMGDKIKEGIENAGMEIKEGLYADKKQTVIHKKDSDNNAHKEEGKKDSPYESC